MKIQDPVSSIMTKELKTLTPLEPLQAAKDIFDSSTIHHIPIVANEELVGMLSKTDYLFFLKHTDPDNQEKYLNRLRLKNYKIEEVMSLEVRSVSSSDSIKSAVEIFSENKIHSLPVMEGKELVGLVTTHDIITNLLVD